MAEKENQFQGVVEALLKGMDTVLSTKTVVGEATKIGDTIILPLVDVTFGVGAGAGSNSQKGASSGAGGLGGKMTPSAVLVIKDGSTKLVNIKNQDTVTKLLDMIPDIVDKISKPKTASQTEMTDAEVVDIAFPDTEE
ncbi:MAG: GerW family sporulation protein [Lachnospiraceae bacterium]|nr:GerW family sporulation protein [Lachnospiraceae bacterium]